MRAIDIGSEGVGPHHTQLPRQYGSFPLLGWNSQKAQQGSRVLLGVAHARDLDGESITPSIAAGSSPRSDFPLSSQPGAPHLEKKVVRVQKGQVGLPQGDRAGVAGRNDHIRADLAGKTCSRAGEGEGPR